VFPIIGAHVVGMYALVLVVGDLIDRIGRTRVARRWAAAHGGVACASLLWVESVPATARPCSARPRLEPLVRRGRRPSSPTARAWERGKLLGFNDLLSGLTGAALALAGGVALTALGVAALAIGGAVLVVGPAVWILREGRGPSVVTSRT
jgi:hypothetical protein